MSTAAATALLDQLRASFAVHIGEVQYLDAEGGQLLWLLTARSNAGERWSSAHEDYYLAACGLAGLMGFELEDG